MPTKEAYQLLTEKWLQQAKDDISWAKDSYDDQHYKGVCLLSQQIIEKALKAYLFHKVINPPRTHDLSLLLDQCASFDTSFSQFIVEADTIKNYYIATRYPDLDDDEAWNNIDAARDALEKAQLIWDFVRNKIPQLADEAIG